VEIDGIGVLENFVAESLDRPHFALDHASGGTLLED
jgi:hypothetical protein